jgi:[ribosomal protein S18]-alanine N-acetyltransferase
MNSAQTELTLRYMQAPDLSDVVKIDEASFNPAWTERSYRFEINESQVSFMLVLEKCEDRPITGFKRLLNTLRGQQNGTVSQQIIVGYAGLWKIADEAHISTIASHPDYRGRKYGEIMLVGMIARAIALNAAYVVLEVRESNTVAQSLYRKYDFVIYGVKQGYYHHNNEDAYDMRLHLTEQSIRAFRQQHEKIRQKISFRDSYSDMLHPRLGF